MRALILLTILLSTPALAGAGYRPAFDQTEETQDAMQFRASNSAGFSMCTTCSATFQVWKVAELVKMSAQCEKDYAKLPEKAARCVNAWQTFLN